MKVRTHLWTSVALGGGLWFVTGSSSALVGAVTGGVLIDADHVFDQIWSIRHGAPYRKSGRQPQELGDSVSGKSFLNSAKDWFRMRKLVRLPLIFHSYELLTVVILAAAIVRTPGMLGLVMGYTLHLALDLIRHHHEFLSPAFYLLSYRLKVGFRRDRLIKPEYL
jgi:hypothetical protein